MTRVTQAAAAGWYPDPENPTQQRYWDGTVWTQHFAPVTVTVPTTATAPTTPSECAQCGASIGRRAKFCEYCGAPANMSELESVLDYHQERHKRELEVASLEREREAELERYRDRQKWKGVWLYLAVMALLFGALGLLGVVEDREQRDTVEMPAAPGEFEGDNFRETEADLIAAGFINVETVAVPDLIVGVLNGPGEVKEVSINGHTDWDEGSRFPKDARIVIRYHDFPVKE